MKDKLNNKDQKWWTVGFWYTEYGTSKVQAKNATEAEKKIYDKLSEDGLDDLVYTCNDRDMGAQDAQEILI